jgi:hypothetical protein
MKKINNKNCQECDIVILSTDKKSSIYLHKLKGLMQLAPVEHKIGQYNGSNQHIYILSNDEIKDKDFVYCPTFNIVHQYDKDMNLVDGEKKVIATTDVSLLININCETYKREHCGGYCCGIKKINEKFIEYYIKEFNKGNILNKAFVECKYKINKSAGHFHQYREYYFFANGNNEINILTEQVKKMYSEEEIMDIQKEWSLFSDSQDSFNGQDDLTFNAWFQKFKKK